MNKYNEQRYVYGFMLVDQWGEDQYFVTTTNDVDTVKYGMRACLMDTLMNEEIKVDVTDLINQTGGLFGKRMRMIQNIYEFEDLIYKDLIINKWVVSSNC